MPAIRPVDRQSVDVATATALDAVQKKLGRVPNMFLTFARSPAALNGYLALSGALAEGTFSARQREQIALAVADTNACDYCLAAHGAIGKLVGLREGEIDQARTGAAQDPRTAALLQYAKRVVDARGRLDATEIDEFRKAGLSDSDLIEALANVVVNIFTNYTNHISGTEIDFPALAKARAA